MHVRGAFAVDVQVSVHCYNNSKDSTYRSCSFDPVDSGRRAAGVAAAAAAGAAEGVDSLHDEWEDFDAQ